MESKLLKYSDCLNSINMRTEKKPKSSDELTQTKIIFGAERTGGKISFFSVKSIEESDIVHYFTVSFVFVTIIRCWTFKWCLVYDSLKERSK